MFLRRSVSAVTNAY